MDVKDKEDIILYNNFLNGNNEAFNKIISNYRIKLINFIFTYVKNKEIAEDLAQDTFVYLLINRRGYDFKYSLKSYLYTIAKCRALNYLRKEKKIINLDESYMENIVDSISVEDNLIKEENKRTILNAIQKLKPQYRQAIFLRDIEELKYIDISRILNKNTPQIKVLIHRARKSLEKILRGEDKIC